MKFSVEVTSTAGPGNGGFVQLLPSGSPGRYLVSVSVPPIGAVDTLATVAPAQPTTSVDVLVNDGSTGTVVTPNEALIQLGPLCRLGVTVVEGLAPGPALITVERIGEV